MATPSGLSAQWGFAAETAYGTPVTVDRFLPMRSESLTTNFGRIVADDIIAGAETIRRAQVAQGNRAPGGSIEAYLYNRNVAVLFAKLLGAVTTTGAGPYTHTITPGDQRGDSLTMQIGRPDMGGTVRPFTYEGCKIRSMTIGASQGEPVTMSLDIVAEDEATGTALATPAYPTGLALHQGDDLTVTIDGASLTVYSWELTIEAPVDDSLRPVGTSTISEPLRNDLLNVSGSLEILWNDLTHYNRVANLTYGTLVSLIDNGTDSVQFTSDVRFDQASQPVAGRGVIRQTLEFAATADTADADAITVVVVNADSAA